MNSSRVKLPMIAWTTALLAVASAWGATFADSPWDILLVILAVLGIMAATATFAIWFSRIKAEQDDDQ